MASIRIPVTAEQIAAAGPVAGEGDPDFQDPIERALEAVTGQESICDGDGPGRVIGTIGQGRTTLVQSLPAEAGAWYHRYYDGEPVEPFEFDLDLEDWLIALAHGDPGGYVR